MASMAILLTGADASPSILMLLVSGFLAAGGVGTSGLGPPQPARSKIDAMIANERLCTGKH
jgi:hypothetical protein